MIVPANIRKRIETDVKKYVDMATAHFRHKYIYPQISYNLRGTVAGRAQGTHLVKFNPVLLMENIEDFIARTVPHEVAHCIDTENGDNSRPSWNMRNGRRLKRSIHGPTWKHIMRVFGVDDITRCHTYDVTNAKTRKSPGRKFDWMCSGCSKTISVGPKINGRLNSGAHYWGRCCGKSTRLIRCEAVGVAPPAPVPPQFEVLQPQLPTQGNLAIAKSIFWNYGGQLTRQQFIVRAVEKGMKATTASTYYAGLRARRL